MAFEFKLPDIGEGVAEGEIVEWHVKLGDVVAEDDPMVEVMTDKATVTIGAPRAGAITDLRFGVGETANVGDVIVVITEEGSASAAPAKAKSDDGPAATAVGDIREGLPGSNFFASKPAPKKSNGSGAVAASGALAMAAAAPQDDYFRAKPLATPATRKLARDLSVDLKRVRPTGIGERVTKADVRAFVGGAATVARSAVAPIAPRSAPIAIQTPAELRGLETRTPFVGIRRKIAQRMQTAKNTAAHFTFVEEVHVDRLIEMRTRMKPAAAEAGVKLSYLPFIVKAVCAALKKTPVLNSALDETSNELVYRGYYNIGMAAATPSGLMVPVITQADKRSLLDISREIDRLGTGARAGTLSSAELSGSTFTITSLGKQGGLFATPVLNHPEVGILGVHQMKQKPVVRDGEIVIGNIMLLSLSFDHRIVDGHIGAAFAYDIIEYLENPELLFLEMA
ncbi:MAG: 2-oxo acid dehydrogenase subunit E2 [Deltaproteobacteria bacterium]|nr:2-oxo acid dehydrogenase subunit E2 [Deltaproteobacteria bacterium]